MVTTHKRVLRGMTQLLTCERGAVRRVAGALVLAVLSTGVCAAQIPGASWRYYRPGNTGIQGDFVQAIYIGPDDDPWFGGFDAGFEEGGVAKLIQAEGRWVNVSNIDYPVIGHPNITGTTRVSDIVADANGDLWMATWRSALKMDPDVGGPSLINFASASPPLTNGGARDLDIAPDGPIWFALIGYGGYQGGVIRHTPGTSDWHYWTGGSIPQGGNGWPQLVWNVTHVSIQPKPGGGYIVWADSDNSSAIVSFDSNSQLWTFHEFSYTPGSLLELPGRESVDDSGNLWAIRFSHFSGMDPVYSLDYRTPSGTWVVPPQPSLPAIYPPIWAFTAHGNGQALLADGSSRIWSFDGAGWDDLGIWGDFTSTYSLAVDSLGNVWASGVGGMTMFDGTNWTGFNNDQYGLGEPWPFPSDNCQEVAFRPSTAGVVANPTYAGLHEWDGATWTDLGGTSETVGLVEDSLGRLWSLGPYYDLRYYDGTNWFLVPNNGAWGADIQRDPDLLRPARGPAAVGRPAARPDRITQGPHRAGRLRALDELPVARHRGAVRARRVGLRRRLRLRRYSGLVGDRAVTRR